MTEPELHMTLHSTKCENCGMTLTPAVVVAGLTGPMGDYLNGKTAIGSLAAKLPGRSIWQDSVGKGTYEHTPQRCREARRARDTDD